jgi:hypothetical protein
MFFLFFLLKLELECELYVIGHVCKCVRVVLADRQETKALSRGIPGHKGTENKHSSQLALTKSHLPTSKMELL